MTAESVPRALSRVDTPHTLGVGHRELPRGFEVPPSGAPRTVACVACRLELGYVPRGDGDTVLRDGVLLPVPALLHYSITGRGAPVGRNLIS